MYQSVGVKNIIMCDSKGVIHSKRDDLTEQKMEFAIDTDDRTLGDALRGADMFLGLSKAKLLTAKMVKSMANTPIIFALANPEPEIRPEIAHEIRDDIIIGTGRSDYPNQVNNVLGFPFIFRGALDVRATKITENMKIAAAIALAKLAKESVPSEVCKAYNVSQIKFGKDYIIPKPFDPRVLFTVAPAVAKAAVEDGVALIKEFDESAYVQRLKNLF